ncbi:unnamed protein product, partial [Polarella glacialis]
MHCAGPSSDDGSLTLCQLCGLPELALSLGLSAGVSAVRLLSASSRGLATAASGFLIVTLKSRLPPEVFVLGGRPAANEVLAPGTNSSWEALPVMATMRSNCSAVACCGRIFVLGGWAE